MLNSLCNSKKTNSFVAAQRIPRSEGYASCLKSHVISDKCYKVFYMPNQLEKARLGVVAAKRIMPRSVDRNRAKREVRELFRTHLIKSCGIDVVVMVRNSERSDRTMCRDSLNKLFSRVAMRCTEF